MAPLPPTETMQGVTIPLPGRPVARGRKGKHRHRPPERGARLGRDTQASAGCARSHPGSSGPRHRFHAPTTNVLSEVRRRPSQHPPQDHGIKAKHLPDPSVDQRTLAPPAHTGYVVAWPGKSFRGRAAFKRSTTTVPAHDSQTGSPRRRRRTIVRCAGHASLGRGPARIAGCCLRLVSCLRSSHQKSSKARVRWQNRATFARI